MNTKVILVARILLGLLFLASGASGLYMIISGKGPMPNSPISPQLLAVMNGIIAFKYLLPLTKVMETLSGILLLSGRYVNLAIVLLAPIVVNIFGIHTFVDRSGLPIALFAVILLMIVIKSRWQYFKPLLLK